ncbi:unnamed protein product [Rotaria sp. Silwood2]|nr:unnamed protein product [Rotaria sp. Silwood2]
MLEKRSDAKAIFDNEYRSDSEEQDRNLFKLFNKRLVKRQTTCSKPYHVLTSDNRCVWSCGEGTQPDSTTNECVCQVGYYQTGTDQFGRRVCTICPTPYHVLTSDNRCVWSCGEGTEPDSTTNECVCQAGYYQTDTDKFGRRKEMKKIMDAIFDLLGEERKGTNTPQLKVDQIFSRMDTNGDGKLSKEEFISGCLQDDYLRRLLAPSAS